MRKMLIVLLVLVAFAGAACGSDDPTVPSSPTGAGETTTPPADDCVDATGEARAVVTLQDNSFDPTCFSTLQDSTLHLQNDGQATHTFTIDGSPVDFELQPGEDMDVPGPAPLEPGEYVYYCRFHGSPSGGGMSGTLTIV